MNSWQMAVTCACPHFLVAANLWHWIPSRVFLDVGLAVANDVIFGDDHQLHLMDGIGERNGYHKDDEEDAIDP